MQGSRVNYVGTDGIDTFAGSRFEFRWICIARYTEFLRNGKQCF